MNVHDIKAKLLAVVRRGPGIVFWTPDIPMGIGNFLYLFLVAEISRQRGVPYSVLYRPTMEYWLERLPELRTYVVERPRFTEKRHLHMGQEFGRDFTAESLDVFCREKLLTCAAIATGLVRPDPAVVVVNVRRGDYYSNPVFRERYGFNLDEYLKIALDGAASRAPIQRLHIVSDDAPWCVQNLQWLHEYTDEITYGAEKDPLGNLLDLINAERLVLTNSTFSYWGAYLSNARTRNYSDTWAPGFHARHINGGAAYQLDDRWRWVRELPSGW